MGHIFIEIEAPAEFPSSAGVGVGVDRLERRQALAMYGCACGTLGGGERILRHCLMWTTGHSFLGSCEPSAWYREGAE